MLSGEMEIMVHGVMDDATERERLNKELTRLEKEIAVCEKKLGNPKFVDKAPPAVVAENRERLAEYQQNKEALLRNLAELE